MATETVPGFSLVNGRHLRLIRVSEYAIDDLWVYIMEMLNRAPKQLAPVGTYKDVYENCKRGNWQFFMVVEINESEERPLAGMLTQLERRPVGNVMVMLWMGGRDLNAFMPFFPKFEEWAKLAGCDMLEAWVRKGLTRVLPRVGLEVEQYIMRKRI